MFEIIIAILALSFLIIIHEFGHFIPAKKFGVKVEEFGLGLPPRLLGKKIGETLFSLNLIPLGGFVKLYGEQELIEEKREAENQRSFSQKPIWQRALIVIGGVVTFWIIAVILLTIIFGLGAPVAVDDEENGNLVDPKVQIVAVTPNSPAAMAELKAGDTIRELRIKNQELKVDKVKEVQEFTEKHKGEEIILVIQRGKEIFEAPLIPRVEPPKEEGAMGVALIRTTIKAYSWIEAPIQGILATGNLTTLIIAGWGQVLEGVIKRDPLPAGVQVMGPIGIFDLIGKRIQLGIVYFLHFIAIIAVYLALFNLLPIPALDGGKLLFLGIEAIIKKPIPQKIEQNITAIFFVLLIALMIFVTIKDVARIF